MSICGWPRRRSSLAEARFAKAALADDKRPFWVSFTLDDDNAGPGAAQAALRRMRGRRRHRDAGARRRGRPVQLQPAGDHGRRGGRRPLGPRCARSHGQDRRLCQRLPAAARGSGQRGPERHPRRPRRPPAMRRSPRTGCSTAPTSSAAAAASGRSTSRRSRRCAPRTRTKEGAHRWSDAPQSFWGWSNTYSGSHSNAPSRAVHAARAVPAVESLNSTGISAISAGDHLDAVWATA